jgi:hypothetical protein
MRVNRFSPPPDRLSSTAAPAHQMVRVALKQIHNSRLFSTLCLDPPPREWQIPRSPPQRSQGIARSANGRIVSAHSPLARIAV